MISSVRFDMEGDTPAAGRAFHLLAFIRDALPLQSQESPARLIPLIHPARPTMLPP
jgi:hypothetical protein